MYTVYVCMCVCVCVCVCVILSCFMLSYVVHFKLYRTLLRMSVYTQNRQR
jgi:hypothetical protein